MRTLATALEAYASDHHAYPPMVPMHEAVAPEDHKILRAVGGSTLSTLAIYPGGSVPSGERPGVCLHGTHLGHPYRKQGKPIPYGWYHTGREWIVFAPGPDGVYEIEPEKDFGTGGEESEKRLIDKRYDPTNGTISAGDLWRSNR